MVPGLCNKIKNSAKTRKTICTGHPNTVSHFSYAPHLQCLHFLIKLLVSNILYDNLLIEILSF